MWDCYKQWGFLHCDWPISDSRGRDWLLRNRDLSRLLHSTKMIYVCGHGLYSPVVFGWYGGWKGVLMPVATLTSATLPHCITGAQEFMALTLFTFACHCARGCPDSCHKHTRYKHTFISISPPVRPIMGSPPDMQLQQPTRQFMPIHLCELTYISGDEWPRLATC